MDYGVVFKDGRRIPVLYEEFIDLKYKENGDNMFVGFRVSKKYISYLIELGLGWRTIA